MGVGRVMPMACRPCSRPGSRPRALKSVMGAVVSNVVCRAKSGECAANVVHPPTLRSGSLPHGGRDTGLEGELERRHLALQEENGPVHHLCPCVNELRAQRAIAKHVGIYGARMIG